MRTLLICHEDAALDREGLVRWLGSFSTVAGTVVIREPGGRLRTRIRREIKRVGVWRFLDVLAFRVCRSASCSSATATTCVGATCADRQAGLAAVRFEDVWNNRTHDPA